jgi:hypothetical protein
MPIRKVFTALLGDDFTLCVAFIPMEVAVVVFDMLYSVKFVMLVLLLGWEACDHQLRLYLS